MTIFSRPKPTIMRRFKKILKWTGIIIASLLIIFVILVFSLQNKKFNAAFPDLHASADSAVIARGKYLAFGPAHCSGCHSPRSNQEKRNPVSYTHLRAHETPEHLVCRL